MKFIILFLSVLFIISCKQTDLLFNQSNQNDFTLELVGEERFILDDASFMKNDIEYYENGDYEYLLFYNGYSFMQVDIYDFKTHKIHKKMFLQKDGPDGIGAIPSGLYVAALDSIFIFSNLGQRLSLVNFDGEIVNKFGSIRDPVQDKSAPFIEVTNLQVVFKKGSDLVFCTYEFEGKIESAGAIFNMNTRVTKFPFSLPNIYNEGWWAGVVYDRYYHAYNKEKDIIIQSFGNDHNIYVVDAQLKSKAFFAKSNSLPDKIKPYSKGKGDFMKEEQYLYRHAALQGGYSTIKYDPWQKVYYRFVLRPVLATEYHSPSQTWSNVSILILDENFNTLGEFEIPKKYSWYQSFVSKRGLSFFDKTKYGESEDAIVFGNFRLKKVEK
jgi:hypothetical protein